ncbi:MAG: hypothetical protein H5U33_23575, partial [Pseudomonas sp.]|nr:hypothetical protein [Pseudomonas sp.]
ENLLLAVGEQIACPVPPLQPGAIDTHASGNTAAMLKAVADMESASLAVQEGLERVVASGEQSPALLQRRRADEAQSR